jgi:hypothetical protein
MNPYQKLLDKKRKWTPVRPDNAPVKDEVHETIQRVLAIRHMELPVGDFIQDALAGDVPELSRELLLSNIKDEENHDLALGYVADVFGTDPKAEAEALKLREAWIENKDHTILKAMVAERAIFFVLLPFLRFNGNGGMRTVSADISRDERTHVACNSLICEELGLKPSQSLDKLRKATINWILQPLNNSLTSQYERKNFWLDASDRLMYEGKAPELNETKRGRMISFFEHSNVNLPQYG